jgi:hypothetical protein
MCDCRDCGAFVVCGDPACVNDECDACRDAREERRDDPDYCAEGEQAADDQFFDRR